MKKMTISETHIKILFFIFLVVVLGGIHIMLPDFYQTVWHLWTARLTICGHLAYGPWLSA